MLGPNERRLATIETITEIGPIPDADAIVRARIRGWDVVVKKDEFKVGDQCVYFEIDSWLPMADERFAFLAPRGVKVLDNGLSGHVLKTAKLRGQYSQGLALPLTTFPEIAHRRPGDDVTEPLGVVLWEPPIPDEIANLVIGPRPAWIPRTHEDRVQNIPDILQGGTHWIATEKVDGESCSVYVNPVDGAQGVCSRQWDYKYSGDDPLWGIIKDLDLHHKMRQWWPTSKVALQGEVFGSGVKKNPLRLNDKHFLVFTVYVGGVELPRDQWPAWLVNIGVPVRPELKFPETVEQATADVENLESVIAPGRPAEGVVWRRSNSTMVVVPGGPILRASFKVISNRYLLKNDR